MACGKEGWGDTKIIQTWINDFMSELKEHKDKNGLCQRTSKFFQCLFDPILYFSQSNLEGA